METRKDISHKKKQLLCIFWFVSCVFLYEINLKREKEQTIALIEVGLPTKMVPNHVKFTCGVAQNSMNVILIYFCRAQPSQLPKYPTCSFSCKIFLCHSLQIATNKHMRFLATNSVTYFLSILNQSFKYW